MITLPNILSGDKWDGVSPHPDPHVSGTVPNKETEMNFAEHQRIVFGANGLLASMAFSDEETQENQAKAALACLQTAYESPAQHVLYVTKGIHQPFTKPHLQLTLTYEGKKYVYHLNVSASAVVEDAFGNERFHWQGVQFTASIKIQTNPDKFDYAEWPEEVNLVTKNRYKNRRDSISPAGLVALINAQEEEKARRLAQSMAEEKRNAVKAKLATLKLTLKNQRDLQKLVDGEEVVLVTQTRKNKIGKYANGQILLLRDA